MRNGLKLIRFARNTTMMDDAPWTWESNWNSDMPDFFQVRTFLLHNLQE